MANRQGLYRLVYASRATNPASMGETLRLVVSQSIQNNRLDNLTGFLAAGEGWFLQLLEGPGKTVADAFVRIGRDPRHDEIRLITDGPADTRLFRDWNMGQHEVGVEDAASLSQIGLDRFTPAALDEARAVQLLTALGARYLRP